MRTYFIGIILSLLPIMGISQDLTDIDEITPFSENLAAVRKGDQWGFINKEGQLVIDFRDDLYWNKKATESSNFIDSVRYPKFHNGRCLITHTIEDGIPVFGFIDTEGKVIIEPKFLNILQFDNDLTIGIMYDKVFRGENEFKLKIFKFKFHEVILHKNGEIMEYLSKRDHIQMTRKRYQRPLMNTKLLSQKLIAKKIGEKGWQISKLEL